MGRLTKSALLLIPGAIAACGDSNLDLPETATLAFSAPVEGTTLGSADDLDLGTAGLQTDVTLIVTNNLADATATLTIDGSTLPPTSVALTGGELLADVVFPGFTLPEGDITLTASIESEGEIRASASISVTVELTGPDGTPTLSITAPEDGITLTADDDLDPALAGTQVTIEATTSDIVDGTTVRMQINGSPSGSAAIDADRVIFPSVTLPQGDVEIELSGELAGTAFSDAINITVADNGCGVSVAPLPADGCGFTLGSEDEDSETDGLQTSFVVTTDCSSAQLFINDTSVASGDVVGGTVTLSGVTVPEGEFSVRAEATDGERTGASQTLIFGADFTAPVLAITDAPEDGVLTEDDDIDTDTDGIQFALQGTASADTTSVTVSVDGTLVDTELSDDAWSAGTLTVNSGETAAVVVTAVDTCGNTAILETNFTTTAACEVSFVQTPDVAGCDFTLTTTDDDDSTEGLQTSISLNSTCDAVELFIDGTSVGTASVVDGVAVVADVTIPDGAVELSATATTTAGAEATAELTLQADLVGPEVAIDPVSEDNRVTTNDDSDGSAAGIQFTASGTFEGAVGLTLFFDASEAGVTTDVGTWTSDTLTITDATTTELSITAVDACGNQSTATVDITGDTSGPTIEGFDVVSDANDDNVVVEAEADSVSGGEAVVRFAVTFGAGDEVASVSLRSDLPAADSELDAAVAPGTNPVALAGSLVGGSHNLTLVATDTDGNTTSASVGVLAIDLAPPAPELTVDGNRRNGNLEISWTADSDAAGYEFRLSDAPIDDWDALDGEPTNVVIAAPTPGETQTVITPELSPRQMTWYFAVRATDEAGQTADGFADAFVGLLTHEEPSGFLSTTSAEGVGDLNNDGFDDFIVSGTSNTDLAVQSAYGVLVVYGGPDPTDLTTTLLEPPAGSIEFGYAANGIGDVNGDGANDLYVSSGNAQSLGTARGGYIYFGTTVAGGTIPTTPAVTIEAPTLTTSASSVLSLGTYDMHGWGDVIEFNSLSDTVGEYDDIVLGAGGADNAGVGAVGTDSDGIIFVIAGRANDAWPATLSLSEDRITNAANGIATILPTVQNQRLGRQTAIVSDSNADGFDEIVAFAAAGSGGSPNLLAGRLLQFRGEEGAIFATSAADAVEVLPSNVLATTSIFSLNGADGGADVNGDGLTDVVAIDTGSSTVAARCEILLGAVPFSTTLATFNIGTPDVRPGRVSLVGDLDVNVEDELSEARFSDLVLRVRDRSDVAAPRNIVLYENLGEAPWFSAEASTVIYTAESSAESASEVSSAGDVDGDGFSDIVLTALPGRILLHY